MIGLVIGYLSTIGLSAASLHILDKAYEGYLKREGYEEKKIKKSKVEEIVEWIPTIAYIMVPIINLVLPACVIFKKDDFFREFFINDMKEGKLIEIEESQEEEEFKTHEEITETASNQIKKYQDMTLSEKLEYIRKERDRIDLEYDRLLSESFEKKLK